MTLQQWLNENNDTDKNGDHISEQWTGIDEDGDSVDINTITSGSGRKMLWKCSQGHQWYAKIMHRTSCLSGCPICSKLAQSSRTRQAKLKNNINDLETWCNNNNAWGNQIKNEFTGLAEDGSTVELNKISYGSKMKVLWRCMKGHEWYANIHSRTYSKTRCPYCSGSIPSKENNLYDWCINNNRTDLINQFVGEYSDGKHLDIYDVSKGSHAKVMWEHITKSGEKHRWSATVKHRTLCDSGCPYCNGSKKVLRGFNDLETWCYNNPEFGQVIRREFTGIDINKNKYNICDIATFSSKNLLWRHYTKSGELHEWYAAPYNRISHKTLCPICNNKGTSLPEQVIYRCIKQVYPKTISRGKFKGYEFDISIPELKICIEYGSTYYHADRKERDEEKKKLCEKYNVNFIQIIDDSSNKLDETWSNNLIITKIALNKIECIEKIVKYLCKVLNIDYKCIDFKKAINDSIEFMNS